MRRPSSVLVWPARRSEQGWELLLLRRVAAPDLGLDAFWQGVTGALEADEDLDATARRELLEETGFEPAALEPIGYRYAYAVKDEWRSLYPAGTDEIVEHVFVAVIEGRDKPALSPEHDAWRWCDLEQALALTSRPQQAEALRRAVGQLEHAEHRDEARDFWNRTADDWELQVGEDGDRNRQFISDPVLWRLAGEVSGLAVLDAGCGTGYLASKLQERGARVVAVDVSERMIEIARRRAPEIDFRVDSCATLSSVDDGSIDLVLANYLLMDTPDLEATVEAFWRVLKPGGAVVAVFSHPCFAQGSATESPDGREIHYRWSFPYFEPQRRIDPAWAHFTSDFVWFHRPLSAYWRAFRETGFDVVDFDEPRLEPEREPLVDDPRWRRKARSRPYSVAFRLMKPATSSSAPPRPASS